jgi:hypothetical protein
MGARRSQRQPSADELEPLAHDVPVTAAAFSPDGTRLVTVSRSHKTARVWDASTGKPLTEPLEHREMVTAAAFSPDGARLVTASDRTVRVCARLAGDCAAAPATAVAEEEAADRHLLAERPRHRVRLPASAITDEDQPQDQPQEP